ncbi:putative transcription-silencing protein [Elsinoe fawcettii]|nr:putative transcription-silencing protein [Elsinoe fawcettii]
MGRFHPLYISRSDGRINIVNRHKIKEKNEPTPDQLDTKPDANGVRDYYREVDLDEQKHLDWRRKLGGMLARDLGQSDTERGYMLASFPENYRLYEHVKRSDDESKGIKTVKNHAGGGNERQDAYLYGHPLGRKKRFRSPADFYPHLLWLATDQAGDPDNCSCKICCPEEIDEKSLPAKKETKQEVKQETKATVKQETLQKTPMQRQPSQDSKPLAQGVQASLPKRSARPDLTTRNADQQIDMTYGVSIFRQGELVWFNRGSRWGLGVITRRGFQAQSNPPRAPVFTIQPLSHPYQHPSSVQISLETHLRPWLAWSVPNFTHSALNSMPVTFETADWQGIYNKKYGEGDMEVDGSILAAKAIDISYTPFDPITTAPSPSGPTTTYNGIYLGAERLWVGDPVRLRTPTNSLDIMILHSISELTSTSAFNTAVLSRSLTLTGDVYSLRQSSSPAPIPPDLPQRVIEDLTRRNAATQRVKGLSTTYTLTRPHATIPAHEIKGRWYEASLLSPVMNGQAAWEGELARGEAGEMGPKMNGRLDCVRAADRGAEQVQEVRRGERVEALGGAVPGGLRIEDAVGKAMGGGEGGFGFHPQEGGLEEFMNLDG